jgi:ribosomal protein S18 acetylase RimI-like enzyme
MSAIEIRPLAFFSAADSQNVAGSYTVDAAYRVVYSDSGTETAFALDRVALDAPVTRRYNHFDRETLRRYARLCRRGFCFGAYDGDTLAGALIAELHKWNRSLWVYEFHVAPAYRGRGAGRAMLDAAAAKAREAGLRVIVCETQNRNALAIDVYRRLGFRLEGIDISYYTNDDYPDRDVAVFMKRRLSN